MRSMIALALLSSALVAMPAVAEVVSPTIADTCHVREADFLASVLAADTSAARIALLKQHFIKYSAKASATSMQALLEQASTFVRDAKCVAPDKAQNVLVDTIAIFAGVDTSNPNDDGYQKIADYLSKRYEDILTPEPGAGSEYGNDDIVFGDEGNDDVKEETNTLSPNAPTQAAPEQQPNT